MESLDIVEQVSLCFVSRAVAPVVGAFPFQHSEKALTRCIVAAMADSAHRADQRVTPQEALVVAASELTASIRVENDRPATFTLPDRHLNGTEHHLTILTMMHRPTDHQLAEQIDNHTQEQLALISSQFRNVGDPLALRFQR